MRIIPLFLLCLWTVGLRGQPALDTLRISRAAAEEIFLQENLLLLAAELDVSDAEARVIQARLWPNPVLSVEEINLWTNSGAEQLGTIAGSWGSTAQVAVEVEQLIRTAAKRRKQTAMEQVGVEQARMSFEDVLRNLKLEFRSQLADLWFTQQRLDVYQRELSRFRQQLAAYGQQVTDGYAHPGLYLRLQAFEVELLKSVNGIKEANLSARQALAVLMGIDPQRVLVLNDEPELLPYPAASLRNQDVGALIDLAMESRPDLKAFALQTVYADKQLAYEQAARVPDVAVSLNYDRGGNIMRDFVGLNISMALPFFDRNQGGIRMAQHEKQRSALLLEQQRRTATSSIVKAWNELMLTLDHYEQLNPVFEEGLDNTLSAYHRSFADRDISLVEYLDFLEAYLATKDTILATGRDIQLRFEALYYAVGYQVPIVPMG